MGLVLLRSSGWTCHVGYGCGGESEWGRERRKEKGGGWGFGVVHCLSWWFPDDGRGREPTSWASLTRLQGSGPSLSAAALKSGFTSLCALWVWFKLHNWGYGFWVGWVVMHIINEFNIYFLFENKTVSHTWLQATKIIYQMWRICFGENVLFVLIWICICDKKGRKNGKSGSKNNL